MKMRAKFKVDRIDPNSESQETLHMSPVARNDAYPPDGSDEDNTYAQFSPSGKLELTINNPALVGAFKVGDKYYLDFTQADVPKPE